MEILITILLDENGNVQVVGHGQQGEATILSMAERNPTERVVRHVYEVGKGGAMRLKNSIGKTLVSA